ncbi:hypothetical protein D3C75_827990 [compost metagenome]
MGGGQPLGGLGRNVAAQQPFAGLDHRGGQAETAQGRGGLQPDHPAADHQGAGAGSGRRRDGAGVVGGAQIADSRVVRQGQAAHAAAHGQHQLVEGFDRSIGQSNLSRIAVERHGLGAQFQAYVQLGPAFDGRQPDRIGFCARQVVLGQAWTFVGGVRLVPDDENRPRKTHIPQ